MKINISATLNLISVFIALFCYIARRKYSLIIVRCKSFPRFCCPYGSLYNFSFRRSIVLNAVFPTRFFFVLSFEHSFASSLSVETSESNCKYGGSYVTQILERSIHANASFISNHFFYFYIFIVHIKYSVTIGSCLTPFFRGITRQRLFPVLRFRSFCVNIKKYLSRKEPCYINEFQRYRHVTFDALPRVVVNQYCYGGFEGILNYQCLFLLSILKPVNCSVTKSSDVLPPVSL